MGNAEYMGTLYRLSAVFADLLFNLIRILSSGAQINHTKNDCFKTSKAFEPCCKGTVNQPTNVGCFGQTGWNERTIDEKYIKKYGSCWCFSNCRHIRLVHWSCKGQKRCLRRIPQNCRHRCNVRKDEIKRSILGI